MTSVRSDTSSITKRKNIKVENLRINSQTKGKDIQIPKSQFSPIAKNDRDCSLGRRSSSKKLKTIMDENEDAHEIEYLKNKLDKLPTKRIYFKKFDYEERNRINKQINKFLNSSDIIDNNAPFFNKLKMIRNSSLPFITINAGDMSVLKMPHTILDNIAKSNGRNKKIPNISRDHSNSFDNISFNFKKNFIMKKNILTSVESFPNKNGEEQNKRNSINKSDDSELMHFLEDLKENNTDKNNIEESNLKEKEDKNTENCEDSLIELENFLLESGFTTARDFKRLSEENNKLNIISSNLTSETKNKADDNNFNDNINETYATNMSKKKVTFLDVKTIIKYEKKGDVRVLYLFSEDDVLLRKIINNTRRSSFNTEKLKSILVKKNELICSMPSMQEKQSDYPKKKLTSIKMQNIKSRFLDKNNYIAKKTPLSTPMKKHNSTRLFSFIQNPKTINFISKNVNQINEIADKRKNKDSILNISKRCSKTEKKMKRISSVNINKLCENPIKLQCIIPNNNEIENLKSDSTYSNSHKYLTDCNLNNSLQNINIKEFRNIIKLNDSEIISNSNRKQNTSSFNLKNSLDDKFPSFRSNDRKNSIKSLDMLSNF